MTTVRGEIIGDYAHDAADSLTGSFPIKVGGVAKNQDGTTPNSVAEDDRVHAIFDLSGAQFINIGHPYFFMTSAAFTAFQTVTTQFITAPGANLSIYVTDLIVGSDTSGTFSLAYGSAVTAGATTILRGHLNSFAPFNHSFRVPLKLAANQDLSLNSTMTNTSFTVLGYIGP